jgi:CubicO group peptidase (beta-lactamase class C family)
MLGATPLAVAGTAHADPGSSQPGRIPRELRPGGEYDKYVARLAAEDKFSGTVLLTYRGRTVLERAYGMADKARAIRNEPGTLFNLGSNTKMFTGVAIGQLAQQGKIHYSEKVGAYLDGFAPEVADKVTVHQLLTHTSGLGDFHRMDGFLDDAWTWNSVEETWNGVLSYVRKGKPAFPPGSSSSYSNSGYFVLGAIVAAVSGQSYYSYIRDHVFEPAGMATAAFVTNPRWRKDPRVAHPYATRPSGERVDVVDEHQLYVGMPAGGSFASTGDMARFADALANDKLLEPAFKYLHFSPKLPTGPSSFVGYGTLALLDRGHWVRGHGGGSPGVSAIIWWLPDIDWTVLVHSNYDSGAQDPGSMARNLITKLY